MSGLLLICVVLLWFVATIAIARTITSKLTQPWIKWIVGLLLVAVLVPLPVADEIIGGFQFRGLCEAETKLKYDQEKLVNKTVYSKITDDVKLENMIIPVVSQTWTYPDINTHKSLVSYKVFDADGGWLSRAIHFNYVHKPYTFNGHCGPGWVRVNEIFKNLNVTIIKKSSGE